MGVFLPGIFSEDHPSVAHPPRPALDFFVFRHFEFREASVSIQRIAACLPPGGEVTIDDNEGGKCSKVITLTERQLSIRHAGKSERSLIPPFAKTRKDGAPGAGFCAPPDGIMKSSWRDGTPFEASGEPIFDDTNRNRPARGLACSRGKTWRW